jgi:hypothetical protein
MSNCRNPLAALRCSAFLLAFVLAAFTSRSQTLSPGEVRLSSHPYQPSQSLRSNTNLVQLEVVVRDTRGRPVPALTKDNFVVLDSGKPATVTSIFRKPPAYVRRGPDACLGSSTDLRKRPRLERVR